MRSDKYANGLHGARSAVAGLRQPGADNPMLHRFRVGLDFALSGARQLDGMWLGTRHWPDYVDQVSTRGSLVVTSLDPMYHYGSYFMPATERFLDGFLPWLASADHNERISS